MPYEQAHNLTNSLIIPSWNTPNNVKAFCTTRTCGNLAAHVNDDPTTVANNRNKLVNELMLPSDPLWLNQTHSNTVIELSHASSLNQIADASFTQQQGVVCAVLTADCLPVLLCDKAGTRVAAIHAGWRGLYSNIIAKTLIALNTPPAEISAWLGPAISCKHYEVSEELYQQFLTVSANYQYAFSRNQGHWYLDLYKVATLQLTEAGVTDISGGNYCTYAQPELFYSYRREQGQTGRLATLIYTQLAR